MPLTRPRPLGYRERATLCPVGDLWGETAPIDATTVVVVVVTPDGGASGEEDR